MCAFVRRFSVSILCGLLLLGAKQAERDYADQRQETLRHLLIIAQGTSFAALPGNSLPQLASGQRLHSCNYERFLLSAFCFLLSAFCWRRFGLGQVFSLGFGARKLIYDICKPAIDLLVPAPNNNPPRFQAVTNSF